MTNQLLLNGKGLLKYSPILAMAGLSTVLSSCLKNDNNTNPVETNIAALSIINASPNARTVNFSLDANKVNNNSIAYLNGIPYVRASSGDRRAVVTNSTDNKELANRIIKLNKDTYYSLYIAGVGAGNDSLDYVFTADSLKAPAAGKVRVRFIHLSPDTAPLDLAVDGQATNLFSNQAYKSVSQFIEVAPVNAGALVIKDRATGTVVSKLENTTLSAGNNYTIFAKGAAAATVNDLKVGIRVINHNTL